MIESYARQLRNNPTKAEYFLWYHINRRQINQYRFRRQQKIGIYIVDFVCYEKKLIIEVDGGHHASEQDYDQQRTEWLQRQGFKVLRFWNNEILTNISGVKEIILSEMNK